MVECHQCGLDSIVGQKNTIIKFVSVQYYFIDGRMQLANRNTKGNNIHVALTRKTTAVISASCTITVTMTAVA